jgi:hypothetical protein
LKQFAADRFSEAARRLTNLFVPPQPTELGDVWLEDRLIHRTSNGETVRSKSEVIIANLLHAKGLPYAYELERKAPDGTVRYPDFTIEDTESGTTVYWEHLGLLEDPLYRARWEKKLAWYRDQRILPFEEGGGPNGVLVMTRDDERGGIDSESIAKLIDRVFF